MRRLVPVVVAAAVALTGCTSTVAGEPLPGAAAPTAPVAAPGGVTTSPTTALPGVGAESVTPPTSLAPGSPIGQVSTDGAKSRRCTAGFVARRGDEAYLVTAGHCLQTAGWDDQVRDFLTPAPYAPIGRYVAAEFGTHTYRGLSSWPGEIDMAVVKITGAQASLRVAGKYTASTVLTRDRIKPGTIVCKFGQKSGESCAPITAVTDDTLSADLTGTEGDSGAPVYVKLGSDRVAAAGVLSGPGTTYLIDAPLKTLGLSIG